MKRDKPSNVFNITLEVTETIIAGLKAALRILREEQITTAPPVTPKTLFAICNEPRLTGIWTDIGTESARDVLATMARDVVLDGNTEIMSIHMITDHIAENLLDMTAALLADNPGHPVMGMAEIATALNRPRPSICRLRRNPRAGFPEPDFELACGPVWLESRVRSWVNGQPGEFKWRQDYRDILDEQRERRESARAERKKGGNHDQTG